MAKSKPSKKTSEIVAEKMHKMANEDLPIKQKLAIAYSMAEKKSKPKGKKK